MDLDNVCTVRNRNEYSTKQVQAVSLQLQLDCVSTLLVKN